jgi:hypothetical protein
MHLAQPEEFEMKKLRHVALLSATLALICGSLAAEAVSTVASAQTPPVTETALNGPVESDQTPPDGSDVTSPVTAPTATSVSGQPTTGLSTAVLFPDDTDSPYDLQVYTSTASGTSALTGVVTGNSGVLPGATVTLQESAGGPATTVSSDANGGFAFANIPVSSSGTAYTLTVSAAGYGTYTVTNDTYLPDETYTTTVEMAGSAQSYDESQQISQGSQATSASGDLPPYASHLSPPPTIKVEMYDNSGDNCTPANSNPPAVRQYPFQFYSLHVTASEIYSDWPENTVKANMLAETNFAWYYMRNPAGPNYNITNTSLFQCFKPGKKYPTKWAGWLDDVLKSHYRNLSNADIHITHFNAGAPEARKCDQSAYRDSDTLSQDGSVWLVTHCGYKTYQAVDNYYYDLFGKFAGSSAPPVPDTSYSLPAGAVRLSFPSRVRDGNGHISDVGWVYTVDYYKCVVVGGQSKCAWLTIYHKGWDAKTRTIPTAFTYHTSGCYSYRAKAENPVGSSKYASFNHGSAICPGS